MGKQEFFQEEIYKLNREVRRFSDLNGISRPMILSAFDSSTRAVNYFPVRDDPSCRRWSLDHERDQIEAFLKDNEAEFREFLDYFDSVYPERTDGLHSFLIRLYNSFPVNPNLFIDGIVRRFLPAFVKQGHLIRYAFVNLLHQHAQKLDYTYFPWVDVRFFYGISPGTHPVLGAIADQETERAEKYGDWFGENHGPAAEVLAGLKRKKDEGLHLEPFFFEYLQPLFMGYEKNGSIFTGERFFPLKDQEFTRFAYLLILPFYDAWIDGSPCGALKGNILVPFNDDPDAEKRRAFIEKHFEGITIWFQQLSRLLFESRSHRVLRTPVQFGDEPFKDFLSKISLVQDWETARVFSKTNPGWEPKYCFKRNLNELWKYQESWDLCEPKGHCMDCLPAELKDVTINSIQGASALLTGSKARGQIYLLPLKDVLDPKTLPSIRPGEAASDEDHVLCLEFPKDTYFPEGRATPQNLEKLGRHYTEALIPVLDKVLLKNKFVKHSVKSAVAAIISRNHSHHIGSHVTPRCSLEKVIDRLDGLGYQETTFEKKARIAGILKSRLDHYIQKKADFVSEIATEPLTTTKTLSLFNEIVLPFTQNTLLMDNIGANEGVNYKADNGARNRLRIHVHLKDRELKARFKGGASCSCNPVSHLDFPYSGYCRCPNPSALVPEPEMTDVAVAVPGPLGEFAFYAFLENMIRNAAKHNHRVFRDLPELPLDIHIQLSELGEDDEQRDDFYKMEIWDDVTQSDAKLTERLQGLIKDPVIDEYGQLKKRAWGIAEMKIMANLLGGSGDFSRMESSLDVKGGDRLVYEFRVMKPKEIAVVSKRVSEQGGYKKKAIWCYTSLEEFLAHQKKGASPAAFNMLLLDSDVEGDLLNHVHLLPNRVLVHHAVGGRVPGAVRIGDEFMEAIPDLKPEQIISRAWRFWLKGLADLSGETDRLRTVVFFGQEETESPTKNWLRVAEELEGIKKGPRLSVIYQGEDTNEVYPEPPKGEKLLVFDRHFGGSRYLREEAITFHEAFDKNSLDFVPIFSSEPSGVLACQMAESAYLRVLVMDERISEVAYEEVLQDEWHEAKRLYRRKQRISVNKWANVFLATHLKINEGEAKPLHHSIGSQLPRVLVEISTGDTESGRLSRMGVSWLDKKEKQALREEVQPHILIIHQGVIENFLANNIPAKPNEEMSDTLEAFFTELREIIPFIVVDSGRGIPANLPAKTKFMPFSLIEDYLMRERISKFSFMKILMNLIRRGNP